MRAVLLAAAVFGWTCLIWGAFAQGSGHEFGDVLVALGFWIGVPGGAYWLVQGIKYVDKHM